MTPDELRAALDTLGWSQTEAARELGVGGGQARVNDWCQGRREVPAYIAKSVAARIELEELRALTTSGYWVRLKYGPKGQKPPPPTPRSPRDRS